MGLSECTVDLHKFLAKLEWSTWTPVLIIKESVRPNCHESSRHMNTIPCRVMSCFYIYFYIFLMQGLLYHER